MKENKTIAVRVLTVKKNGKQIATHEYLSTDSIEADINGTPIYADFPPDITQDELIHTRFILSPELERTPVPWKKLKRAHKIIEKCIKAQKRLRNKTLEAEDLIHDCMDDAMEWRREKNKE